MKNPNRVICVRSVVGHKASRGWEVRTILALILLTFLNYTMFEKTNLA